MGRARFIGLVGISISAIAAVTASWFRPAPDTKPPPPVTIVIAHEAADAWRVELTRPQRCQVGVRCELVLELVPAPGWHANALFPFKLTFDVGGGLSTTIRENAIDPEVGTMRMPVSFTAELPGPLPFHGVLRASACNEDVCRIDRHELAFLVPVR